MAQFFPAPPQYQTSRGGQPFQPMQPQQYMHPRNSSDSVAASDSASGTNRIQILKQATEAGPLAATQPGSPAGPWHPIEATLENQSTPHAQMVDSLAELTAVSQSAEAEVQDIVMYSMIDSYGNAEGVEGHGMKHPVRAATWSTDVAMPVARPSPSRQLIFEQYSRTDTAAEAAAAAAAAASEQARGQATRMDVDTFTMRGGGSPEANPGRQSLHDLEATIADLLDSQREVRCALAEQAAQAAGLLERQGVAFHGRHQLPCGLPALTEELALLGDARCCVRSMQDIQVSSRHLEQLQRKVEAAAGGKDRAAYFQHVSGAIQAFSAAARQATVLRNLEQSPAAQLLLQELEDACIRVDSTRNALYSSLLHTLQQRLDEVGWPPPLTGAGSATALVEGTTSGAAEPVGPFEGTDDATLAEVQHIIYDMASLQRSADPDSFAQAEGGIEPPLLWPIVELAAPLEAKLRHHFASGLPTDRIDRPEWLFGTALRAAREGGVALAPLQPALHDQQSPHSYQIQEEYARGVREVVKELLRTALLPRLLAEAVPSLWVHFIQEAVAFECQLAQVRGLSEMSEQDADNPLVPAWALGSTVQLLFERDEWRDAWLSAEAGEAEAALEEALDAANAWQRASHTALLDLEPHSHPAIAPESGGIAWQHEFWAPSCAEAALTIVEDHARHAAWLPTANERAAYLQAVPQACLGTLHTRLQRLAKTAEDYRELTSATWAPRVGAYICTAHFLEHHLQESPVALLLMTEQAGEVLGADVTEAAADHKGPFEGLAAQFGRFQQQWVNKLAVALAAAFTKLSERYRRSLDAFAGTQDAASEGEPSARLLPALEETAGALARLAASMDAVAFRGVWRGFATSANKLLYNDVATEARFSPQGGAQFAVDCGALLALLQPFTPRPAAHFKELLDAASLLTLNQKEARTLCAALQGGALDHNQAALRHHGIARLSPERALVVLKQRIDVLHD